MNIPPEAYRAIEQEISSDTSPVGIDAKKTHVLILHKLAEIEARLGRLEEKLDREWAYLRGRLRPPT